MKLVDFVEAAWEVLEPSEQFRNNWHIELICEHLEAVSRGEIKNLLINVPPGCMKSLLVSVMWPAWEWTRDRSLRYLAASYSDTISLRDNLKCRDLIRSEWYQRLWPQVVMRKDLDRATKYALTDSGWRMATSVRGAGTGEHPDRKIVDDPSSVLQSESDVERQGSLDWFDKTLSTRGASRGAATVVIMQRLHERDLSGHIMNAPDFHKEWTHLCLPMEYEGDRSYTKLSLKDPRTEIGELLWPSLFDSKKINSAKMRLGEYGTAGQFQQRPSPAGGGILKTEHFQLWPHDVDIPDLIQVVQSYDTAFTDKTQNDPTACTVWGTFRHRDQECVLLLDSWEEHLSYPELRSKVIDDWSVKYGGVKNNQLKPARKADYVLIEEKGSGISLIQDLRGARIPIRTYNPGKASKEARAHLVAPILEMDCIYVLESKREPGKPVTWARGFLSRVEKFPNDDHDDAVDTFTQAMIYLRDMGVFELQEAPEEVEEVDYSSRHRENPYSP